MSWTWATVWPTLVWMLTLNLFLSILLCVILFWYPKWIIRGMQMYYRLKHGFSVRYIALGGAHTIAYMERGNREDCKASILLVHGFSSSKDAFAVMCGYLSKRFHIIALDLPGHGGSTRKEKEDCSPDTYCLVVKKFVDKIGLGKRKFHLLGCSLGGYVAGLYAAAYPDDLISLTLTCPAGVETVKHSPFRRIYEEHKRIVLIPETTDEFREMMAMLTHKRLSIPGFVAAGAMQLRKEANWFYRKLADTLLEGKNQYILEERLNEIRTPVLLIWGRHDQILDVESVEIITRKLPTPPKTVIFEDCGHCIHFEQPRKLMGAVTEFLNTFGSGS